MSGLKHKAVSGVKWSIVSQTGRLGTQLITTIILARLLLPSDFGLVGMAMVVISFVSIFKDLGTSSAIIQRKNLSDKLLSSIFWINVGFGSLATIVLCVLAPLGGLLYQEPRVVSVLQILSINFFFSGFGITHQSLLERSVAFDSLAKLEITSAFTGAIIGIGLALVGGGVWSLVVQTLATTFLSTLLLWRSSSWRPRWVFFGDEIRAVSSFSLNLTGFNVFNYFARNADYLLIGRYLGADDLGYYTLAYRILLFPVQGIAAVVGRVLYPIFSTIQDDNERFASTYLKVVGNIALITFPLMAGILALARPFILIIFGEKWEPVILLTMIFAPLGLIQSIGTTVGTIYQAKGRTDWMFKWGIGSGTFVIVAILFGLRWGIVGVATSYALASFSLMYPSFAIPFRLINLKVIQLFQVLYKPLLYSSVIFLVIMLCRYTLWYELSDENIFSLSIVVGATIYALLNWLTNREQIQELWLLIWQRSHQSDD